MKRLGVSALAAFALSISTPAWGQDVVENSQPTDSRSAQVSYFDRNLAMLLTFTPPVALAGASWVLSNPWPACAIPVSLGCGYFYLGEPLRGTLVSVGAPLLLGAGAALGAVLGLGMDYVMEYDRFQGRSYDPPYGYMLTIPTMAVLGIVYSSIWGGSYLAQDLSKLVEQKNRELAKGARPSNEESAP